MISHPLAGAALRARRQRQPGSARPHSCRAPSTRTRASAHRLQVSYVRAHRLITYSVRRWAQYVRARRPAQLSASLQLNSQLAACYPIAQSADRASGAPTLPLSGLHEQRRALT